jgi:lipopolysaccharide export system protein LptA
MRAVFPRAAAVLLALATALAAVGLAAAQEPDLKLPISMDADSADYDGKTSMLMYRGLKLTQGSIGVQADVGRASNLDFENSVWHFSGNVVIEVQNGRIECETADLKFEGHQLQTARITGSPATFQMQRPDSKVVTRAEAGKLLYDFSEGTVEFSENATITEGGNRISSEYLVYNIEEQRIKAQSAGDSKVRIKYTPHDPDDDSDDDTPQDEQEEPSDSENEAGGR